MKNKKSTRNLLNSSSRRKDNNLDLVDRISALPDSILGLILSCLPTKNAVATTILSKRWKFVWMTVHNLDFYHNDLRDEDNDMKFIRFVNRVLLLHGGGLLNKFRLVWSPKIIPSQVSKWIKTAIARNLNDFVVSIGPYARYLIGEPLEMPISVFSCDSLQSLELNGRICVSAAIVVCLPRLESLKLDSVYFQCEEAFDKLISGCPMLNYLHLQMDMGEMLKYSKDNNGFKYIISSTSLRRLELLVENSDGSLHTPSLYLEASSLEYLKLDGFIPKVFVQGTLSSLVEADFRVRFSDFNSAVEAVRALDCAKVLTLSPDAMWAIHYATISLSTKFMRLTKLDAGAISCYCSSLQDFMQCSDNLEVLTFGQDQYNTNWIAPVEVPRCLSNSLKEVSYKGYAGFDGQREMIGYMLKHGSVLEVMQVTCYTWKRKKVELVKEICSFPRKSPACKVTFID